MELNIDCNCVFDRDDMDDGFDSRQDSIVSSLLVSSTLLSSLESIETPSLVLSIVYFANLLFLCINGCIYGDLGEPVKDDTSVLQHINDNMYNKDCLLYMVMLVVLVLTNIPRDVICLLVL